MWRSCGQIWRRWSGGAGAGVAAIGVVLVAAALIGTDGARPGQELLRMVEQPDPPMQRAAKVSRETGPGRDGVQPAAAGPRREGVQPAAAGPRPMARPEAVPVRPEPRALAGRRVALLVRAGALADAPPEDFEGLGDLGFLAVAIYHEARDQPLLGQRGVAAVILRRAALPRWGETVCDVVQPVQFSFLAADGGFPLIDEPDAWRQALAVAVEALTEGPPPALGNADHYHATRVAPAWGEEMQKVARIGAHVFYSDPRSLVLERRAEGDRQEDLAIERAAPPPPRPGAI
jgi:hypothetical protein